MSNLRAKMERARNPTKSWCLRCERPWGCVEGHSTRFSLTDGGRTERGCFPLCEGCWDDLATPEARMPYYRELYEGWLAGIGGVPPAKREAYAKRLLSEWTQIEAAVDRGE